MVNDSALAVGFAVFSWWIGTGVILWLDRLGPRPLRWSLLVWTGLLGLSVWGVKHSMANTGVSASYLGFASVIVMWGWHELAFLSGWLSGPRRIAMSPNATGWQRLREAVATLLWHELALIANFVGLLWLQSDQPNHVALCTFALLWCMRVSAKLNLFFGVPLHSEQYLPPHLAYLASYFRVARPGWWFYGSVSVSTATWSWLVWSAQTGEVHLSVGWVLLASLLGLALVEHAVMVLPWPVQKIWGWAMAEPETDPKVVHP
jgi:putative photosynthetic complex assembly protein 2